MPWFQCTESSLQHLSSSECPICLHSFRVGDRLSSLPCCHVHHHTCLSEWLHIRASCPMCKAAYPECDYSLPQLRHLGRDGAACSTERPAAAETLP